MKDNEATHELSQTITDIWRGLAAVWVMLSHTSFSADFQYRFPEVYRITRFGFLGVPIFFVISGYCLGAAATAARARNQSPWVFLQRRLVRIFIPYWFSVAFCIGYHHIIRMLGYCLHGDWPPLIIPELNADVWTWIRTLTLTQGLGVEGNFPNRFNLFCGVYWTLGIEMQFYLVVTAALWWGRRSRSGYWRLLILVTLLAIPAAFSQRLMNTGLFLSFWLSFFFGMMLHTTLADSRPQDSFVRQLAGWMTVVCGSVYLLHEWVTVSELTWLAFDTPNGYFRQLLFAAWFTIMLATSVGFLNRSLQYDVVRLSVFGIHFLGVMSYTLYLFHVNLASITQRITGHLVPTSTALGDGVGVVVLIVCCMPIFWICERQFSLNPN